MNLLLSSLAFILIAFVGSVISAGDVIELTDSTFESKMKEYEIALVKFYAPWCGHCKRMAPEFDKAATILKANDPPVALVKVDCTVHTAICGKLEVSGYPTLKIFRNGEFAMEYNGPREADGIIKFMRSKAGPSSKEAKTVADLEKFLAVEEHSIVGFFSKPGTALETEFKKVADLLSNEHRFAHSSNAEVLAKYNHKDQIVIFQPPRLQVKLESAENVYTGPESLLKIKSFIKDEMHGICGHRELLNAKDFHKRPLVVVYYNVDFNKDSKGTNYVRNRIIKVAQKLKAEGLNVNFAISNVEEFNNELTEFNFKEPSKTSKLISARGPKDEKYKFEGEYSPENLEKFARDVIAGTLEPFMKSEPIPESTNDAVRTVVAKNFDQVVNDDTKDVLIEFYAPWCGHCKSLAPKYEELATKLKDEDELVIAKMDATANDVPAAFDVKGFPTLYFVPKNSKNSPRRYEGGREVDDFLKYLAKESTNPLKGYDRTGKKVAVKAKKTDL